MFLQRTGAQMKPFVFAKWYLVIIMLSITTISVASSGLKKNTLKVKINEISMLRVIIIDKIDQAIEMRHDLVKHLAELQVEIRSEQIRTEIISHEAALQNLRIRYNLSLVQTLQAYITLLNERIDYFQTGNERLKFLIDQIHDDLAIIDILKDMEIQNLIDRIDMVLNEFVPETQKQIINATQISLQPSEYVWEIVSLKPNSP